MATSLRARFPHHMGQDTTFAEVTFLLTLPFDAGVPTGDRIDLWHGEGEPPGEWTPELLAQLTEAPYVPEGGQYPWVRLEFSRGETRSWPTPDLADRVFSDRVEELLSGGERCRRRLRRLTRWRGTAEVRTVVAASRYFWLDDVKGSKDVGDEGLLTAPSHLSEVMSDSLLLVLERLGAFLSGAAMASGQVGRRVLLASDLPPMVPALLRFHALESSSGLNTVLSTRLEVPTDTFAQLSDAELGFAHLLFEEHLSGNEVLRCLGLLREAAALESSGQYSWSVILASAAVEMFCRTVLRTHERHAGSERGRVPFRDVLARELPPLMGLTPGDPPPGVLGRWQSGGYQTRNALVHEGKVPARPQGQACLHDAEAICLALVQAINAEPSLAKLKDQMPFGEFAVTHVGAQAVPLSDRRN